MSLIRLDQIVKTYGTGASPVMALRGVDLAVEEQGFVALMGPSGSGKSTLLGILGAMSPPTTGRVVVDGIDVYSLHHERRADFRREYLGFVFQQLYLVPYLTAIENVCLPLAAAGLANARQHEMATGALERVGLADKADRLPQALSGGEQQRVAIARAVVNNPRIILADEPTGCLDSQNGQAIMALFGDLRASGLTIFMVTHDSTIASHADRIVHLRDGRLVGETDRAVPAAGAPSPFEDEARPSSGLTIH
jgi:putative ABC transport system ATP-binding protein